MNKIKKFFIEKPEGNIWKKATIYLILFRYVGPLTIFLSIPLMLGLLAPNQELVFNETGEILAESFTLIMGKLYDAGSSIAIKNPIISKVIAFAFANMMWVIYMSLIYFLIDVLRYFTSWIYSKFKPPITQSNQTKLKEDNA